MAEGNDFELIVLKGLQRALKSAIDTGKDASQIDRLRAQLRAKEEEIAAKAVVLFFLFFFFFFLS